jgi:hypothetical protein
LDTYEKESEIKVVTDQNFKQQIAETKKQKRLGRKDKEKK